MRALPLALLLLASCATGGRDSSEVSVPGFRARSLALATVRGARGQGVAVSRATAARLEAQGLNATALEETDSVLAGSAVSLENAMNKSVLDEIRRATGADAVVFLSFDPNWRSLDVSAIDARTGDAVLRTAAHPRAEEFSGPEEAAAAAVKALMPLASERRKPRASQAPGEPVDEIPAP